MMTLSLPFSATLLPQNLTNFSYRCVLGFYGPLTIKSMLVPSRRRRFSSANRIPSFSGVATESSNNVVAPASVPVRVAHELLQAGHHYLDVRTCDEYADGHVVGAVNVPFLIRVGSGMSRNPKFLEEVWTHFDKDSELIVGCQLGKRSLMAASELQSAGFTGITDMAGGYAAWIQNGLPIE